MDAGQRVSEGQVTAATPTDSGSRLSRLGFIDVRHTSDPVRRRVRSRGVPASLADHELFYTEDPAEAAALIGTALAPGRLVVPDPAGFAASLHGSRH